MSPVGRSRMAWDFITLLRMAHDAWIAHFWKFAFNIFRLQLPMGNWNCRKRNMEGGSTVVIFFLPMKRGSEDKGANNAVCQSCMRTPRLPHILCSERALCLGYEALCVKGVYKISWFLPWPGYNLPFYFPLLPSCFRVVWFIRGSRLTFLNSVVWSPSLLSHLVPDL